MSGAARWRGPVEADEAFFGGKEGNKHASKRLRAGRGTVGKAAVAGLKDRQTNRIKAQVVDKTDRPTLQGFVHQNTEPDAVVYTDEALVYETLRRPHEAVRHSVGEYVRNQANTNGLESFWAMLKRGHDGIYHHYSPKHLDRYVDRVRGQAQRPSARHGRPDRPDGRAGRGQAPHLRRPHEARSRISAAVLNDYGGKQHEGNTCRQ